MIVAGELDHIPEKYFLYKGNIDEVMRAYEESKNETK
jgi:F0F1-type ATP synthase beta subunit